MAAFARSRRRAEVQNRVPDTISKMSSERGGMVHKFNMVTWGALLLLGSSGSALSQSLRLNCVQQSRYICEQKRGCGALQDAAPNQWTFEFGAEQQSGKVLRCAGKDCGAPFEVLVRRSATGEIYLWEPVANETFAFSRDQRVFTHSLSNVRGDSGHVVAEFGHCVPQF